MRSPRWRAMRAAHTGWVATSATDDATDVNERLGIHVAKWAARNAPASRDRRRSTADRARHPARSARRGEQPDREDREARARCARTRWTGSARPPPRSRGPTSTPRPPRPRGGAGRRPGRDRSEPRLVGSHATTTIRGDHAMPTPAATDEVREGARLLARLIEPLVAQVYFSPECHARYAALGFSASPGATSGGVALPDGPAYFTSRGSALGQAPGELVAAAFGVFNAEVVVPSVTFGWSLTDAATIADERLAGRGRAARAHPRPGAGGHRARQRAAVPGRGTARALGPCPLRRHAVTAAARHAHGRSVPARRPPARVPRATATSPHGWPRGSTPRRSASSRSRTGACPPAPTSARGHGARPSSTPPRSA